MPRGSAHRGIIIFGYSHATACSALRPVVSSSNGATVWHCYRIYILLLGYCNYYAIHGSPYTSAHVLIEGTLVQHKNNGQEPSQKLAHGVVLPESSVQGTNQCYGLHSRANISVHSASVTVLGLLDRRRSSSTKRRFSGFQVSYLKHSNSSCTTAAIQIKGTALWIYYIDTEY